MPKTETVTREMSQSRQGDVLFIRVKSIPKNASEQRREHDTPFVVAHSETGHHHVVRNPGAQLFETDNPLVCFLRCEGPMLLEHMRDFDMHGFHLFEAAGDEAQAWEVRRQREQGPEGWRRAAD